jgi:tryptophan synthase alpha chain
MQMETQENRIERLFKEKKENILNIYFTAGFPRLEQVPDTLLALQEAGVDLIEIGMPYSDPLADGPTIQESGAVALQQGMTLPFLFEQIAAVRSQLHTPLILMGYFNQVMQYGDAAFFQKCRETGVDGLILPDLPLLEYEKHYKEMIERAGLAISFLITPQTSPERIQQIDALSRGFIYMVSSASITGAKEGSATHKSRTLSASQPWGCAIQGSSVSAYPTTRHTQRHANTRRVRLSAARSSRH